MVLLSASFFAALVAIAVATQAERSAYVIHERRDTPARGFVKVGLAPSSHELTLRISLKPNNIAGLEKELYAVSDPKSERYGKHLTLDEVVKYVKPTSEALSAVNSWLDVNKITAKIISPAGDTLQFNVPVSKANSILNAEFSSFTHSDTKETAIRTLQYSLPADLSPHVAYVHPTTSFTNPFVTPKIEPFNINGKREIDPSCADLTTLECLLEETGIPKRSATQKNNVLGISGFSNQFAHQSDLKDFLAKYRPEMSSSAKFDLQFVDGGSNTQVRDFAGVEASLDMQYAVGLSGGVPLRFISVGPLNDDKASSFLDQVNALIADNSRPTVLSTSYGFNEQDLTLPVAEGLCNAYMQLGALGTSVLTSSGERGVGGNSWFCDTFLPTAPSSCPWVTSVGASQTILENYTKNNFSEVAASFSAGGFSNYFKAPAYQEADVSSYVASINGQYEGRYNKAGRGIPDVSAQGVNFVTLVSNEWNLASGTSASTPVFAAVVAHLNAELIAAGKRPLGFLNPFLYSAAGRAALNDVSAGNNPGCDTSGFNATVGWDPVTGLGTPNYVKLRKAVGLV
ncbi:Family S53 protease-like protein [Mycena indigotica]|uniref:tripeptidyl-peptidase II n=1 Tax=Mycena indigotica TaxID=2126181 RepID=A0A8H6SZ32_9AGAR|nr:Family S53 protease-like protein [Mycena indigotica]KAF7307417.1 Family S53 protease-like protein [Mycena indigotica]